MGGVTDGAGAALPEGRRTRTTADLTDANAAHVRMYIVQYALGLSDEGIEDCSSYKRLLYCGLAGHAALFSPVNLMLLCCVWYSSRLGMHPGMTPKRRSLGEIPTGRKNPTISTSNVRNAFPKSAK